MVFYDFEVLLYNWLVCAIDPAEPEPYIIIDNPELLKQIYEQYKNDIWIGFNSRHYDQYILKGIICGFDAWEVNDYIINKGFPGWSFSSLFRNIFLINYDCAPLNQSLKQLEGFQGHNIHESGVDFKIDRPLTDAEITETVEYCLNDVKETMGVFAENVADFEVQLELIKEFNLPLSCMAKTQTQLTAEILQAEKHDYKDDFDLDLQPYLENIKKYKKVVDWYKSFITKEHLSDYEKEKIYSMKLEIDVAGAPHKFGWGGAHGAKPKYHGKGWFLHIDVHQYYPSLVISNNFFPRSVSEEGKRRYAMMKDESVRLKAFQELKKKRNGYKLCNNKMTGGMKDKNNKLYDPKNNNNICVGGQLAILLLIEMLEPYVELIQSNTDGIIVKLPDLKTYEIVDDVCFEWEGLTGVSLGFDPLIKEIYQKDVNSYLFVDVEGYVERKGGYVKELNPLDNDLPIVNKALVDYMTKGIPVEKTILDCDDLMMFQKICKLTSKFEKVYHTTFCDSGRPGVTKEYFNKCYRIFASTDSSDGTVYKVKEGRLYKFANTSENSFIENGDITEMKTPSKLDYQWYINLANERLRQYGVN